MTENIRLEKGEAAPAFSLTNDQGREVALADYAGRRVLVYFYPRANTPGCTTEACDFAENLDAFNSANVAVIGISPDSPEALAKFRADHALNFELLSDPGKSVMEKWGAYGEKQNYGKTVTGVIRSSFLVGPDGTIEQLQYNVRAKGHVGRILRDWGV
ncbi:thioredoxin-dependent thiol peroxidase [Corynebacterium liangguodongii]|uniref:thioredoxin-dependent peroxiredoxin n=1 Tax=Corynebacterium liangguodongii TaxID=2079535 RepID=A0A2S0WFP3_9CORY|nr:thioredoxin-dependent thiol peroxidase [Corynebacterium liangguodongii]AWB84570.1 thioredoxin-dependent thiol peroxidase [Corynebacterium liangguodongii]PWB98845.1 thioredoxin-dependent thiol peroxidase [Corynebacterium liangguodongii]